MGLYPRLRIVCLYAVSRIMAKKSHSRILTLYTPSRIERPGGCHE
jgi:hypothetical protein